MATYEYTLIRKEISKKDTFLKNPENVIEYIKKLKLYTNKEFWREKSYAILVDHAKKAMGHFLISEGVEDKCLFSEKLVCRIALTSGADSVVLLHNHPGGDPRPSQNDIQMTEKVNKALKSIDLSLVDHIIIGEKSYFSFAEEVEKKCTALINR